LKRAGQVVELEGNLRLNSFTIDTIVLPSVRTQNKMLKTSNKCFSHKQK